MKFRDSAEDRDSDGEAGVTLKHSLDIFYRHLSMGFFFSLLSRTSLANLRSFVTVKDQDMNSHFERAYHLKALRAENRNAPRKHPKVLRATLEM